MVNFADGTIVDRVSKALRQAEQSRVPIDPVSNMMSGGLTLEIGHAVCEANLQRRLEAGRRVVGYKIGSTNNAVRIAMGLPAPTYGYLLDNTIVPSGGTIHMDELIDPRIECEICFRMGADLKGEELTISDVLDATDSVSASFEICDSRIKDWKCPYPDWYADNGFAARVVLPGRWTAARDIDLPGETTVLAQDSRAIADGQGRLVMEHPARAVAWLARSLTKRGRQLEAGMLVMTGSLTPVTQVTRGSVYATTFSTLGSVDITFV